MKNILIKFIKNKNSCTHKNALLNANEGYCPDCGEYLVKNYYIVRCLSCGIKREAKLCWSEVVPVDKYCKNCGENEFYVEKLDKISFVDANFAIYKKEIIKNYQLLHPEAQIWVEKDEKIRQLELINPRFEH